MPEVLQQNHSLCPHSAPGPGVVKAPLPVPKDKAGGLGKRSIQASPHLEALGSDEAYALGSETPYLRRIFSSTSPISSPTAYK
jgi:hypothetical protein